MVNLQSTQPIQSIDPLLPTTLPQVSIDPNNPLCWVLVLTLFFGTGERTNATANLVRAIATLINALTKNK